MNTKSSKATLSLEKALTIIEIMSDSPSSMRLLDIANSAGIPSSTALRLLNTLQIHGYVNQDKLTSRYSLSLKLFHIGSKIANNFSILNKARPFLEILASRLKHSINFSVLQNENIFILDVVGGAYESPIITTQPGGSVPLYCTALGRAIMCHYTTEQIDVYLESHPLRAYTSLTITDRDMLIQELQLTRTRGYSYDRGELRSGIAGVGTWISDGSPFPAASISVADLASSFTPELMHRWAHELQKTAHLIAQTI